FPPPPALLSLSLAPCGDSRKPGTMNKTPITYRQEKNHMMGSMERSFTDQSTLQEDERMALSFMDAHTCSTRSKTRPCTHMHTHRPTHTLTHTLSDVFHITTLRHKHTTSPP